MEKILLVCPEMGMKKELTFLLQHSGFRVAAPAQSKEVLHHLCDDSPDLVVMQETLHRLNGDELCLRIRELSDVPIIILGQCPDDAAGVEMLEMGADAYLTAPLNAIELLARVRSLLRRRRAARASITQETEFGHEL